MIRFLFNIETLAKEEDQECFLHYQVVDIPSDSKEFIAVRFNTMDEKNIGIIDEHGNVIKEPFLHDNLDCYCGEYSYPISMKTYYGDYIDLTYSDGGIYNRDLEKVTLSEEEQKEWDRYIYLKTKDTSIENGRGVDKIYEYFGEPEKYKLKYLGKIGENGIYTARFVNLEDFLLTSYTLFLDENYELISHLYYSTYDATMLLPPSEGSKVGLIYVKDLGIVYFNIDGEIIWITYCDYSASRQCDY